MSWISRLPYNALLLSYLAERSMLLFQWNKTKKVEQIGHNKAWNGIAQDGWFIIRLFRFGLGTYTSLCVHRDFVSWLQYWRLHKVSLVEYSFWKMLWVTIIFWISLDTGSFSCVSAFFLKLLWYFCHRVFAWFPGKFLDQEMITQNPLTL